MMLVMMVMMVLSMMMVMMLVMMIRSPSSEQVSKKSSQFVLCHLVQPYSSRGILDGDGGIRWWWWWWFLLCLLVYSIRLMPYLKYGVNTRDNDDDDDYNDDQWGFFCILESTFYMPWSLIKEGEENRKNIAHCELWPFGISPWPVFRWELLNKHECHAMGTILIFEPWTPS